MRSWNAAQPVLFLVCNVNQNSQRGAEKEGHFVQVKQLAFGKQPLVETESELHQDRGARLLYSSYPDSH